MLKAMPEVREKIISYDGRLGIMGVDEVTTDIPEHAFLANDTTINWDERARGLGGTVEVPITTCAEENLLCYSADPYYNEDILIHEFAHAIHLMGLQFVYAGFNDELNDAYTSALNAGKWANTYAATNMQEYWAEGVQSWFNCNAESDPPNGIHNHVNTRAELQQYDEGLYALLHKYFGDDTIDISCHNY
jgi:alpha-glucosidase